ncbi:MULTISPECIES: helix-turn-helix domain-containing protein [Niastella]|uniref:Helix-turn-helix transcriptional regulator n=1 Tax=Niastella soli TaxID=2821487 RepID=A0ABS3YY35_9BACT|nr:helix-turn-helix transcriptional regulator [Niastella soli]MBO9202831.1 helix-turn-helix transcriptional regulator [Niastella soli]
MEKDNTRFKLNSIADAHRLFDLPKPLHPLITLVNNLNNQIDLNRLPRPHVLNFYKISFKTKLTGKLRYGQGYYDFEEGGLMFASPGQVISNDEEIGEHTGYTILIHPDFFLGNPLSKKIKEYGFFSYAVNEALHLSDKEKETIVAVFEIMEEEFNSRIDDFSQDIIIAQIELLLNYAERFYKRQFITRRFVSNDLLQKLEAILDNHFSSQSAISEGIPTVQQLAEQLNISASYLSDMLRSLTGQNAQQLIHHRLIEKAKEILSTSDQSVAEIAYQLGFEHPQSFSRLFKTKTNLTPQEFRRSFN